MSSYYLSNGKQYVNYNIKKLPGKIYLKESETLLTWNRVCKPVWVLCDEGVFYVSSPNTVRTYVVF